MYYVAKTFKLSTITPTIVQTFKEYVNAIKYVDALTAENDDNYIILVDASETSNTHIKRINDEHN